MFVISGAVREQRTAVLQRRPGRRVAHARQRLIAFDRRHQVRRLVPDVSDVRGHGVGHQPLDEDVPLLGELRAEVGIPRAHLPRRLIQRLQLGEAGRQRARPAGRVVVDRRLEEEWRVERQPEVRARPLHVLGNPVGATHHPSLGWTPRTADARLEAFLVGLVERAALAAAILGEDLLARLSRRSCPDGCLSQRQAGYTPSACRGSR